MRLKMLINNFKKILNDKKMTIKDVVLGTGLSRNTLSNIANNPKANVANSTLDTLCLFLEIDPKDFYEYHNFLFLPVIDIDFENSKFDEGVIDYPVNILLKILRGKDTIIDAVRLVGNIEEIVSGDFAPYGITVLLNFETKKNRSIFEKYSKSLSLNAYNAFLEYLKQQISLYMKKELNESVSFKDVNFAVKSEVLSRGLNSSQSLEDAELVKKALMKIKKDKQKNKSDKK